MESLSCRNPIKGKPGDAKVLRIPHHVVHAAAFVITVNRTVRTDGQVGIAGDTGFERPPTKTFAVHGESSATEEMVQNIKDRLGWRAAVAKDREVAPLV